MERPDTAYVLAQTVIMQDFALRNAKSQIEDLQRQLSERPAAAGTVRQLPRRPVRALPAIRALLPAACRG